MKKIKLLYTLSELMFGSKTRQLVDLVTGLDKDLYEIEIAASTIGDEATNDIMQLNVPVHQIRLYPPHSHNIQSWYDFATSALKINHNYNIVHSLHYSSFAFEPLLIKVITNAKYIYSKSNPEWDNHPKCWNIKSKLADKIIAGSSSIANLICEKGFSDKVDKIYYGIDTDWFVPSDSDHKKNIRKKYDIPINKLLYGCAAQLLNWKNQKMLINVFSKIANNCNNIYLVLCGQHYNDKYYDEVIKLILDEGLENNVKYIGVLSDMREFYNMIDCFVLPSINEAFGLVFAEAMSCSIPVIGSNSGGPLDIIDPDENGYLIDPHDIASLQVAMESYIIDPNLAIKHGLNGRQRAIERFSKNITVERHNKLYQSILGI